MLHIFFTWALLIPLFCGAGAVFARRFALSLRPLEGLLACFWIGWCATLAYLQVWHFFFPINGWAWLPLLAAAGLGVWLWRRELVVALRAGWKLRKAPRRELRLPMAMLALTGIAGLWLANRSVLPAEAYDNALYHMQMVMWNASYPIVRGLANLHDRFGFNNASFLYDTLLDVSYWNQRPYYIANSLLAGVFGLQGIASLYRLVTARERWITALFGSLLLIPALWLAMSQDLVSFSTDAPALILGALAVYHLLALLEGPALPGEDDFHLWMVGLLTCAGITVKLSFVGLGVPAALVGLGVYLARRRSEQARAARAVGGLALLGVVFLVPWVIRGILLSGYPAFPLTIAGLPVPWRVPEYLALNTHYWIISWAKWPEPHWSWVIYDNAWLANWVTRMPGEVKQAGLLTGIAGVLGMGLALKRKAVCWRRWLVIIPPLVGLVYWFASAPNWRFMGASLWALAFGVTIFAAEQVERTLPGKNRWVSLAALALAAVITVPRANPRPIETLSLLPVNPNFEARMASAQRAITYSGLEVHYPENSDQCWKIPLPCTPIFDPYLMLIAPGDMSQGFMRDPNAPYPGTPHFRAPADQYGIVRISGWLETDPATGQLWVSSPASFMIYAEQAGQVRLSILPGAISDGKGPGTQGKLYLTLNQSEAQALHLRSEERAEVPLDLRQGYNRVVLELAGETFTLRQIDPSSTDDQARALGIYEIEIEPVGE